MVNKEIPVKYIPAEKWWKTSKWELLADYKSANGKVEVPTGFVTDGASVPWFLRSYFSPTGRYFGAAIIHDYLLDNGSSPNPELIWDRANNEFKEELIALNIAPWRIWVLHNGTRAWAYLKLLVT